MSYELFCSKVQGICSRAGLSAVFSHEDGKHVARVSDGCIIIGNSVAPSVVIRDPLRNHCFRTAI